MKVFNSNGQLSIVEDNASIPTGASVLTSPVTIAKEGSTSNGKKGNIEAINGSFVTVNVEGTGYRNYSFDNLSN